MVEIRRGAYTRPPVARSRKTPAGAQATGVVPSAHDPLAPFSPPVAAWFRDAFAAPTRAQVEGWPAIAGGGHVLLHAPTGSGKTLAAFLWGLDRLITSPPPPATAAAGASVRLLYVSPLKALTYDVERNLRAPLTGIALAGARLGTPVRPISIASRTGDTPSEERRLVAKRPPEILITTPESLYLMLTSAAREILRGVEAVIVDEVHAVAGTKRGAHLALSLERLEALRGPDAPRLQRIGLSATQRPLETIARFLAGVGPGREVTIVDAAGRKVVELQVVVPVEDMSRLGELLPLEERPGGPVTGGDLRVSIWPAIHPRILELVKAHRSTLIFCNSRRLAERLAQRLNELAGEELVRAHHGSIAREQRVAIEEALKDGRLPALVATSSLELGIDMGAIDLVIQVESPTSVARGLQRIGRAGHRVDEVSRGVIFPKYRGDLLECAIVAERMDAGAIESTTIPRNPLDVLAQQIVAMAVMDHWPVDDLLAAVSRAAPFESLTREALDGVLAMLAGAYPSDEFAELKPRLVWDRVTDAVDGRRDARVVAVTSGGTIPDRGLFGVFLVGEAGTPGRRVGELDEEMVYELRAGMHGDVIVLGASSWRVAEITADRVLVTPAPGEPGKLPFWKGDMVGRPIELGRALGGFVRELEAQLDRGKAGRAAAVTRLRERNHLDPLAAENLVTYLEDEREAAGALPTDRRVVVERFRDELGDWRVCPADPLRRPRPRAMGAGDRGPPPRAAGRRGASIWSDDGIAIRLPDGDLEGIEDALFPDADTVEDLVVAAVGGSALFAARFRENAGRALLLPRRRPGSRTPLWQQRQRSADLLAVASRYGSFPILVETYRECLADVFDLPGAARRPARRRAPRDRRPPRRDAAGVAHCLARSCSTTSPPTCTRATLRSPSGGPRPWPSTGTCSASCWARRSSASCSTQPPSTRLELGLQALLDDRQAGSVDQVARPAAAPGGPDRGRGRGPDAGRRRRPPASGLRRWPRPGAPSRSASAARTAGSPSRTSPATATRSGSPPPAASPALPGPDRRRRSTACWRAGRAPTGRSCARPGPPLGAAGRRSWRMRSAAARGAGTLLRGEFRPGGAEREWCDPGGPAAASAPLAGAPAARGRAGRPAALARFLPAWQGVAPLAPAGRPGRRCAGPRPSSGWPRSSTSSPACRSRHPSWSGTSCRRGSPATSRGCSTSWARSARWPGSGCGSPRPRRRADRPRSGPGAARCCGPPWRGAPGGHRRSAGGPRHDAIREQLAAAARRSTASCSRRPAGPVRPRGPRRAVGPRLGRAR